MDIARDRMYGSTMPVVESEDRVSAWYINDSDRVNKFSTTPVSFDLAQQTSAEKNKLIHTSRARLHNHCIHFILSKTSTWTHCLIQAIHNLITFVLMFIC
jgi:hypothetical protein